MDRQLPDLPVGCLALPEFRKELVYGLYGIRSH